MDNGRNDKAKLLRRLQYGGIAVAVLLAVLLLGNGMWYQIEEQEEAVIVTLGSAETVSEKGLHFKIPVIQQVHKVNTTIQGFPIGYEINSNETVADEAIMITSDYNFIDVDFFVEYF